MYFSYLSLARGLGADDLDRDVLADLRGLLGRLLVFCFMEAFPLSGGSSLPDIILGLTIVTFSESQKQVGVCFKNAGLGA